jgi:hypothetical protein
MGTIREIVDGKLGAIIDGGAFLFDSTQLWKNLMAIGGASSRDMVPMPERKGQPTQVTTHSVVAVPARLKDLTIVDVRRNG